MTFNMPILSSEDAVRSLVRVDPCRVLHMRPRICSVLYVCNGSGYSEQTFLLLLSPRWWLSKGYQFHLLLLSVAELDFSLS